MDSYVNTPTKQKAMELRVEYKLWPKRDQWCWKHNIPVDVKSAKFDSKSAAGWDQGTGDKTNPWQVEEI